MRLCATVLLATAMNTCAFGQPVSRPGIQLSQLGNLQLQVQELHAKADFDKLDELAAKLRTNGERLPDGTWKIMHFYEAFLAQPVLESAQAKIRSMARKNGDELARIVKDMEAWIARSPGSVTAHAALASALIEYAWNARGGGLADTVSDEGWALFRERLARARRVCEDAVRLTSRCSAIPCLMLDIALGEGWDAAKYDALFDEAVKKTPCLVDLYLAKARYLLPRWHGKPGEWESFAAGVTRSQVGECAPGLYFRIVFRNAMLTNRDEIRQAGIDKELLRQSIRAELHAWPKSGALRDRACYAACMVGDRDLARELFESTPDEWIRVSFPTQESYSQARRWALAR